MKKTTFRYARLLMAGMGLLLLGTGVSAQTDSLVFSPVADTYVRSTGTDAGLNYGADSLIKARYSTSSAYHQIGYLKFNLSGLPADIVVDSAKLQMTMVYAQVSGIVATVLSVPDAADSWNEDSVTWNHGRLDTIQTIASVPVASASTQLASINGIRYTWNVSGQAVSDYNSGNRILSLAVFTKQNASANISFLSKESAVVSARPKLILYTHSTLNSTLSFPVADTYVRSTGADANVNFGTDSIIKARYSTSSGYHEMGFLKFDLNSIDIPANSVIDSARLQMTMVYEQVAGAIATILSIPDTDDGWDEEAVTWNSGRLDTIQTIASVPVAQAGSQLPSVNGIPYTWDVTAQVASDYFTGNKLLSLGVFTEENSGANTYFLSREAAIPSLRPQLRIYTHEAPLRIVDFTALPQPADKNVALSWSTPAENGTAYIQVERSTDGVNFNVIHQLMAQGVAVDTTTYSYTDIAPVQNDSSFYRLHFKLTDSSNIFSSIVGCYYNTADTGVASGIRNLNVVYFLPTDKTTEVNYQQRLNGVMYQVQNFYRKWMSYWGYGNRSFGLRRDSVGGVKIVIIHGAHNADYYPYSNGGSLAIPEINAYFSAHPEDKQSTHTLVLFPRNVDSTGSEDVPFYGLGNGWCFALDDPNIIDSSYSGSSAYLGGLVHELGHGLNLPHNKEKVSEHSNPAMGTALMGTGNSTYGKTPTFLTEASTAILNNCEVFATSTPPADLYAGVNASLVSLHAHYSGGNITVNGTYAAEKAINHIIVYNDPEGGSNYDQVPWVSAPLGTDSFSVVMPVSELQKHTGNYDLRLSLLAANGSKKDFVYNYYFEDNAPVIDIDFNNRIDTSGPKIVLPAVADAYANYSAANTNYGSDTLMQMRYSLATSQTYNKIGFVKFDLSNVTIPAGKTISYAFLQEKVNYRQVSGYDVIVKSVAEGNDNWDEHLLTWNNRPDTITSIAAESIQPAGSAIKWNITNQVLWELENGNKTLSLAIYTSLNSGANTFLYSRESAIQDNRPVLILYLKDEQDIVMNAKTAPLQAAKVPAGIDLKWKTYADEYPVEFQIEYSIDGRRFNTIGTVKANGSGLQDYNFLHTAPSLSANYYRLKETEKDGRIQYSNIAIISSIDNNNAWRLSPNPVKSGSSARLLFNNYTTGAVFIKITNISGKIIMRERKDVSGNSVLISTAALSPGLYFIQLYDQAGKVLGRPDRMLVQ